MFSQKVISLWYFILWMLQHTGSWHVQSESYLPLIFHSIDVATHRKLTCSVRKLSSFDISFYGCYNTRVIIFFFFLHFFTRPWKIKKTQNHMYQPDAQHAHSFFSFESTCTPTSTIWGYREYVWGTIILVHGKWDMCYCLNHISESE